MAKVTEILVPEKKRYFSRVPGSKYTFADGHTIEFAFGRFDFDPEDFEDMFSVILPAGQRHPFEGRTKAEAYYNELEYLVRTGNPLVFLQGGNPIPNLPQGLNPAGNAVAESDLVSAESLLRRGGNIRETGDPNVGGGSGMATDVNTSTVDRGLQDIILAPKATGPGAERIKQLRESAAQTQNSNTPNNMS